MSFIQAIKSKIQSISNTQKITRAMEMVSASKLRKAQARLLASRPYTQKIRSLMQHVASTCEAETLPSLFQDYVPKRMGIILISSDRGLCGGLNTNLFKTTCEYLKITPAECEFALIGHQATRFIKPLNCKALIQVDTLGDTPTIQDLTSFIQCLFEHYTAGRLDGLCIASNGFVNTMIQKPTITPVVPIVRDSSQTESIATRVDYLYEPNAQALLTKLSMRYVESQLYHAVIENIACEQAARRLAMKNATDSGEELIAELRKSYHKARQASITQELAEIVSGAEAV